MKSNIRPVLLSLVLSGSAHLLCGQQYTEKITGTLSPDSPSVASVLAVENINGAIRVEGYAGQDIQLEANKTIEAEDKTMLEELKKGLKLGVIRRENSLIVYIDGPFDHHLGKNGRMNYQLYNWNKAYDFRFDFTLKVPEKINLLISTVNKGNIEVENIQGALKAFNINGAIHMKNISGSITASTVNGNVEGSYGPGPVNKSTYTTLNGDVTISYPGDLSADLIYKNTNGSFYTNFQVAEYLPAKSGKEYGNRQEQDHL